MLRVPQMAEQLVDEPVPSFHEFEIFEEEEVEEEQPLVVPESYFRDAAGHAWCRNHWPGEGDHRQARAGQKNWPPWGLWWLTCL